MFPRYNLILNKDGSYSFVSDKGYSYLIYFSEYILVDTDDNEHVVYNFGFTRNGEYKTQLFNHKHDEKIRNRMVFLINDFFIKYDHKALLYFCFGDDGFARHRNITFKKWAIYLDSTIESYNKSINYNNDKVFGSIMVSSVNPLKGLIVDAFNSYMNDISPN